jgi:hypothetical protein
MKTGGSSQSNLNKHPCHRLNAQDIANAQQISWPLVLHILSFQLWQAKVSVPVTFWHRVFGVSWRRPAQGKTFASEKQEVRQSG